MSSSKFSPGIQVYYMNENNTCQYERRIKYIMYIDFINITTYNNRVLRAVSATQNEKHFTHCRKAAIRL